MDPNLMGPSGFRHRSQDREAFSLGEGEPALDPKVGLSFSAGRMNHLFEPDPRGHVVALPRHRRIYRRIVPLRPSPNNREVFLRDPMFLHQQSEAARGCGIFRNENKSAGFAIQAIDDGDLAAVRDFKSEKLF